MQLDLAFCFNSADEQVSQKLFLPQALAPEIVAGDPCDSAADVWSLGLLAL